MLHGLLNQSTVLFFLYMSTETTIEGWQQGRHPAQHSLKSASGILPLGKTADPSLREREREAEGERQRQTPVCYVLCYVRMNLCHCQHLYSFIGGSSGTPPPPGTLSRQKKPYQSSSSSCVILMKYLECITGNVCGVFARV